MLLLTELWLGGGCCYRYAHCGGGRATLVECATLSSCKEGAMLHARAVLGDMCRSRGCPVYMRVGGACVGVDWRGQAAVCVTLACALLYPFSVAC